jgi:hypothetical protein
MNSLLGEKLRYLSDEALAKAIITGTYNIPSTIDLATAMILKEIGKMGIKIVNGDSNEIIITPEDFKRFWKKVNEFTSSSMSGVHYGHYKAAIQDPQSTNVLALQLTIIARSGIPPESWSVGLQVMLEKIAGVCLVEKLSAIQLYEADFNCYNQFIFGRQAMQTLTDSGYIPEELFSQKGSTAEDEKLDKTLMADLSRQARQPMAVVSADAAYCYDRVNHVIMLLVWLALTNGNIPAIVSTLICLQTMKFFQRTGFGESRTFFGGAGIRLYMMGLGQPGKQGCIPFMDPTKRSISKCVQTTRTRSSRGRSDYTRSDSLYGNTVRGRYQPLHVERRSSRPRQAMAIDTTGTNSMEHSTQRNGRSPQT